jgi:APA family basic amino acid/polyamine antiporter
VFSSLALFMLHEPGGRKALPTGIATAAALAFAYSMWAMAGAGVEAVYWGFLLMIGGLPVYVGMVRRT